MLYKFHDHTTGDPIILNTRHIVSIRVEVNSPVSIYTVDGAVHQVAETWFNIDRTLQVGRIDEH
jgi:hypothetical protein